MKWFFKYIAKQKRIYIIGTIIVILSVVLDMAMPYLVKIIIDDVITKGNNSIFNLVLIGIISVTFTRVILGYINTLIFDKAGIYVIKSLRDNIFKHLQNLPFSYFDKVNTGELMSKIKEDSENIQSAVTYGIKITIEQIVYFIIGAIILFYINWKIALIIILFMPVIAIIAIIYEKNIGKAYEEISDQRSLLNRIAQENLSGVRLVKAFAKEKYEINKFFKANKKNYELNVKKAKTVAKFEPSIDLISNIVVLLVTIVGGFMVINKEMSVGTLVACSNYSYTLIWPMRLLGWLAGILGMAQASIVKMKDILDVVPEHEGSMLNMENCNDKFDLKFKNISFSHNGREILKNINLNIHKGQTLAIMGSAGAGKSSIINLLCRCYNPTSGKITINDIDINDMNLNDLRQNISVVMQDTFLFSASIKDNIELGVSQVDETTFTKAIDESKVSEFVYKLSDEYNTIIGERGLGLSGGQKQRVSIARALVKPCNILIFDDSTSALDTQTEYEIQKALENRKDIIKIIIAHRISAVKSADIIAVVEGGEISEIGSHEELMKLGGLYYNTYNEQYDGLLQLKSEVKV